MRHRWMALVCTLALPLAGAEDLQGLLARADARRSACEARIKALAGSCPANARRLGEARRMYRSTRERVNLLVDLLAWDLKAGKPGQGYGALAQEADSVSLQLEGFLEGASCEEGGSPAVGVVTPLFEPLAGGLAGLGAPERAEALRGLEALRWRAFTDILPVAPSKEVGQAFLEARKDTAAGPTLVLETGFHQAPIRQAALAGSTLLTASEDKTVRVWELDGLTPLRVLRPPQGLGEKGKLYALGLSPDGRTVACGGFTGDRGQRNHRVYLFDRTDGRLLRELPDLPQPAVHLAFSPDGSILVIHLGAKEGLRFLRTDDAREVARDDRFDATPYAGVFLPGGRYAVSCDDGYLRLYTGRGQRLAKVLAAGEAPFGLAPSPDGKRLLVGYASGSRVDVVSARTLMPERTLTVPGGREVLSAVAWSLDGRQLFAAGGEDFGPAPNHVYRWGAAGAAEGVALPGVSVAATVSSLLPLADGGLVVAAQDPALLRLGPDLRVVDQRRADLGDLPRAARAFWMADDGKAVSLGWRLAARPDGVFSLMEQALEARSAAADPAPPTPLGPAAGLDPFDTLRARAVIPKGDGDHLLGTDWVLTRRDAAGKARWTVALPAGCWALRTTADGATAGAVLADGTVRWYATDTGREQLAFYMTGDASRWVLWNPQGRFTCSAGGESLLGWLVQGEGQAGVFHRGAAFRERYFTADLGRTPEAAFSGATSPRSAVLEMITPKDVMAGPNRFRLRLRIEGEPPARSKAWLKLDGAAKAAVTPALLFQRRSQEGAEQILELPVDLAPGRHLLEVTLDLGGGVVPMASLDLEVAQQGSVAPREKSALNLVAIGVGKYRDPALDLRFAAKDARDVAAAFKAQEGGLYREVRVTSLVDQQATRSGIEAALEGLRGQAQGSDVTVIFFSGHGLNQPFNNAYAFVPHDATPGDPSTLVDGRRIQESLAALPGKVVLLMDTCHAGNVMGSGALRGLIGQQQMARFINELSSAGNGVAVLSSSTGRQTSLESEAWGNGAFTKALLEGLGGKADSGHSGRVTLVMLDGFLRQRVAELTQGRQSPVSGHPFSARDFPLAVPTHP